MEKRDRIYWTVGYILFGARRYKRKTGRRRCHRSSKNRWLFFFFLLLIFYPLTIAVGRRRSRLTFENRLNFFRVTSMDDLGRGRGFSFYLLIAIVRSRTSSMVGRREEKKNFFTHSFHPSTAVITAKRVVTNFWDPSRVFFSALSLPYSTCLFF